MTCVFKYATRHTINMRRKGTKKTSIGTNKFGKKVFNRDETQGEIVKNVQLFATICTCLLHIATGVFL